MAHAIALHPSYLATTKPAKTTDGVKILSIFTCSKLIIKESSLSDGSRLCRAIIAIQSLRPIDPLLQPRFESVFETIKQYEITEAEAISVGGSS
jgi:hypothetical protein